LNFRRNDPEAASIEAFVQYLLDDDRTEFLLAEAAVVSQNLPRREDGSYRESKTVAADIIAYARDCGLTLTVFVPNTTRPMKEPRGFRANDHNIYQGNPGSGGSGWEQITGMAGRAG
jgi:hypothetical protein